MRKLLYSLRGFFLCDSDRSIKVSEVINKSGYSYHPNSDRRTRDYTVRRPTNRNYCGTDRDDRRDTKQPVQRPYESRNTNWRSCNTNNWYSNRNANEGHRGKSQPYTLSRQFWNTNRNRNSSDCEEDKKQGYSETKRVNRIADKSKRRFDSDASTSGTEASMENNTGPKNKIKGKSKTPSSSGSSLEN